MSLELDERLYVASSGPSSANACRVIVGNSCGSGSIVGHHLEGSLVLTNAHVAGTRLGTTATCRFTINGQDKEVKGKVILAAYSDSTLTDWCVLYLDGFKEIKPVKLSKKRPKGSHYTTGCPKCVWPMRHQTLRTTSLSENSALWRWQPNAIGGQSGSAVWSQADHLQYGLLTWSWGGDGAGQMTSEIYKQATLRAISAEPRPEGLIELNDRDVVVENGFFCETGIDELPIWAEDSPPPGPGPSPGPGPGPNPTTYKIELEVEDLSKVKINGKPIVDFTLL